eukprot:Pgem_evm1s6425
MVNATRKLPSILVNMTEFELNLNNVNSNTKMEMQLQGQEEPCQMAEETTQVNIDEEGEASPSTWAQDHMA